MKLLKKNKLLIYNCFLLLGLILSAGAYADHGHGPDGPRNREGLGQKIKKVIEINARFNAGGAGQINILNYIYNNDYELQNSKLKKVILKAQTDYGRGKAILKLNGQRIGHPLVVPVQMSRSVFHVEEQFGQISLKQIQNLKLRLRGNFYVKKLVLVFEKQMMVNKPAKIMGKEVNIHANYGQRLKVRRLLGLNGSYRGQKVKFVSLTTKGYGNGSVQLLINGSPVGSPQYVDSRKGFIKLVVPYFSGGVLGQDIRSLQVKVDGQMSIDQLMVGLIDHSYGFNLK